VTIKCIQIHYGTDLDFDRVYMKEESEASESNIIPKGWLSYLRFGAPLNSV
jgi:hypothetical protein